ncbi:MAG: YdcF family protein [Gemmatimonas sp.]
MTDLVFRGRGANVGVRASVALLRLCGAALALATYLIADVLGLWNVVCLHAWYAPLLVTLLGAALATTRAGVLLWLPCGVLCAVYCIVLYTPVVRPAALSFIRADAESDAIVLDAVVVLSGGLTDEGRLTGQALDRLLSGVAEAKKRGVKTLALSVTSDAADPRAMTSEADQRSLVTMMAPELEVRLVRDVHSTRDEALAFAALARTHQWQRVLLVTSPLHTKRACAAFEAAGLPVQCQPSRARDVALSRLDRAGNRRLVIPAVLYESAATVLYRLRGWLP